MDPQAPTPFSKAQGAIALTLCDHDTAVWLSPRLAASAVKGWMAFHTGRRCRAINGAARFVFFDQADAVPDFCGFAAGSQDYPDRSATLVLELPSLAGGQELVARGPGIKGERTIAPQGFRATFCRRWATNRAIFPTRHRSHFDCGTDIMCLPRSVQLQAEGGLTCMWQ